MPRVQSTSKQYVFPGPSKTAVTPGRGNIYALPPRNTSPVYEIREPDKAEQLVTTPAAGAEAISQRQAAAGSEACGAKDSAQPGGSEVATQLLDLQDQLYDVIAANHFYYEAVESIVTRYNDCIDRKTHHGWAMTSAWLESSQQTILQTLGDIRLNLAEAKPESSKQSNEQSSERSSEKQEE